MEELLEKGAEVSGIDGGGFAIMHFSRHRVEGSKEMTFLMGPHRAGDQRLVALKGPLTVEGRSKLQGHLVLEEDFEVAREPLSQRQKGLDLPFFFPAQGGGHRGKCMFGSKKRRPQLMQDLADSFIGLALF